MVSELPLRSLSARAAQIALIIIAAWPLSSSAVELSETSIKAIRASPYFHTLGKFGTDDLASGSVPLWNAPFARNPPFAEYELEAATQITLVEVLVEKGAQRLEKAELAVKVTADGRVLLTQSVPLKMFIHTGAEVLVPFLVYGTGCKKVTIAARLKGVGANPAAVTKVLEFRCGD